MQHAPSNSSRQSFMILRLKEVKERLSLSRSTVYDKLNPKSRRYDATFPKPISLGPHAVGWLESDLAAWIASRSH